MLIARVGGRSRGCGEMTLSVEVAAGCMEGAPAGLRLLLGIGG